MGNLPPSIRAVVFDLDDTLYEEMEFVRGGMSAAAAFAASLGTGDAKSNYSRLMRILARDGRGKVFDVFLRGTPHDDPETVRRMVRAYREHPPRIRPCPDAIPALESIRSRGMLTGLITDGNAAVQRSKVAALNIERLFDRIIYTDELGEGLSKPDPAPFVEMSGRLGLDPRRIAYVGDNPEKDFTGAKKIGWHTVRVLRGPHASAAPPPELDAHERIESLTEI
ncbi:MAG: HAD family hydrolase [bacterium]